MIDDTLLEAEEKMDKAVTVAQEDFSNIRTGRVTPQSSRRSPPSTTARRRRWSSSPRSMCPSRG